MMDVPPPTQPPTPMQDPQIDLKRNAEGSRYAVLRRLAPAMRHQLAGSFQPVGLMAAIVEKRLQTATPDVAALAKTSSDVRTLATAATRSSLDLMGWIAPDPEAQVPLGQGIHDTLHLVATELSFKGFTCVDQTPGMTTPVALSQVRGVFVAALLALIDAALSPTPFTVTAQREGGALAVTVTLTEAPTASESASRDEFQLNLTSYRNISWDEVDAIAAADGVALEHNAMAFVLRLPVVRG